MMLLVFLMHACLATVFPIGRIIVEFAPPVLFTGMRMLLGSLSVFIYHYLVYKKFNPIKHAIKPIILFGFFGIYLTNAPEFWALQFVPAAKASFIYSLSPFISAIFSYFYFDEKMTWKKGWGMLIGLIGFSIMLTHDAPGEIVNCRVGFLSLGEMALIVAAIATVVGWMATRHALKKNASTATEIIAFGMLYGGLICILQSFFTENYSIMEGHYASIGFYLVLATIFSSVLGYTMYVYLLQQYTATFLSFAGFFEPFCAAFFGWVFLGEIVTWWFFVAAFFVFIGLYWFYQEELKQGYIVKTR